MQNTPNDISEPAAASFEVVIVGGGAGGLELAAGLGRHLGRADGRPRVLLVDHTPLHIWKPTLHEIAAGTMDLHREGLPFQAVARRNRFGFALGTFCGLDAAAHRIRLAALLDEHGDTIVPPRSIGYRWLVLALGCGSNFFHTPGAEHAFVLEQASDAERFRRASLAAFTKAAFAGRAPFRLAIVGGGATGIELSAELREAHREALDSIDPAYRFDLEITVVEAADRVLSHLPPQLSQQAAQVLRKADVRLSTGTKVTEIRADALVTSAGEIPADLICWAAGIKAPDAHAALGLAVNDKNQFIVNDRLETSAADVLALGDCAACPWHDGRIVPARAQAAHQQADYLRKRLCALLAGRRPEQPFAYRDFGSLVSLGEHRGVGDVVNVFSGKNHFVGGLLAKWMYMSLHLNHLRAVVGIGATIVLALARLLQRRVSGRVKLH